jgi:NitT/TauT family transport system permease protein
MSQAGGWRGSLMLIGGLLALWQALYVAIGDIALRSPVQSLALLADLVTRPSFWPHAAETAQAFAVAMGIAAGAGLLVGFLLGLSRFAAAVFEPVLVALYSIPKVTLYPIVLLAFGLGMPAKIAFGAIHGFVPIALFAINGVRNVRPVFLKAARVHGLTAPQLVRRVLLPAALPEIFSGLRIGFSLTLIGTVLGEMFASQRGLGSLLMQAIGLHNVDVIMAVTLLMVGFAAAVSSLLLAVDRKIRRRF